MEERVDAEENKPRRRALQTLEPGDRPRMAAGKAGSWEQVAKRFFPMVESAAQLEEELVQLRNERNRRTEEVKVKQNQLQDALERLEVLTRKREEDEAPTLEEFEEVQTQKMRLERRLERAERKVAEMEARFGRGEVNTATMKVLRLAQNPSKREAITQEIGTQTEESMPLQNVGESCQECQKLESQMIAQNKSRERLKQVFLHQITDFREACYELLGYKIEYLAETKQYRLWPMYAAQNDQYLLFQRDHQGGTMQVLDTPYCSTLDLEPLQRCQSIPMFLSQLTLDLFQQCTQPF